MTNPGNIVRIRSRNGGRASVYEANMWAQGFSSGLFSGAGVIQNTSADLNVLVGGSPSKPDVVIAQNPAGYNIALDIIGQQAIQIVPPATNSRIASVIAYTDDLSLPSSSATTTGSPASCGLIVVYGTTASSPQPPSDSVIRTAITADGATGSQAVYGVIANITVQSTTTTITNALIATKRSLTSANKANFDAFTHVRAYVGSTMTNPTSNAVIQFNTKDYDTLGEFSTTTYTFTATNAGKYQIFARMQWGSAGAGPTEFGELNIQKNGSDYIASDRMNGSGDANRIIRPYAFATVSLAAGDTIRVVNKSTNGVRDIPAGAGLSYIEIHRVG